jgi:hypothetical protein
MSSCDQGGSAPAETVNEYLSIPLLRTRRNPRQRALSVECRCRVASISSTWLMVLRCPNGDALFERGQFLCYGAKRKAVE